MKHLGRNPFCYYILQGAILASIYCGFYNNYSYYSHSGLLWDRPS